MRFEKTAEFCRQLQLPRHADVSFCRVPPPTHGSQPGGQWDFDHRLIASLSCFRRFSKPSEHLQFQQWSGIRLPDSQRRTNGTDCGRTSLGSGGTPNGTCGGGARLAPAATPVRKLQHPGLKQGQLCGHRAYPTRLGADNVMAANKRAASQRQAAGQTHRQLRFRASRKYE